MGRPIGSAKREKPFQNRLAHCAPATPEALTRLANRLIDKCEEGHFASIRELVEVIGRRHLQGG